MVPGIVNNNCVLFGNLAQFHQAFFQDCHHLIGFQTRNLVSSLLIALRCIKSIKRPGVATTICVGAAKRLDLLVLLEFHRNRNFRKVFCKIF
jgi:hypothetical protein